MDIVTLDLETYYDKDYSLTKMTTEAYVRDPRFEVIGVGIKVNNHPTDWYSGSNPAAFLRSLDYSKCAILAHNCVTGDHEVRTPDGWVRFDQLADGVPVLQWDVSSNALSYVVPTAVVRKPYEGNLLEWSSSFHAGVYTPEHRMYVRTPDRGWFVATAKEVSSMGANNTYIPTAGVFCDPDPKLEWITPLLARLIEMLRADGSISRTSYTAKLHLSKKRKIERAIALLDAAGWRYKVSITKHGNTSIYINTNHELESIIFLLGRGSDKQYGPWVLGLSVAARGALLNELQYWDGYRGRQTRGTDYKSATVVHSSQRSDVYWLAELATMTGMTAVAAYDIPNRRGYSRADSVLHNIRVRPRDQVKTLYKPKTIQFAGTVYCVTVPTGAFLIRRNGRTWVTGNCAFDGAILSWHFGIKPKLWLDTLSMARPLHNVKVGGSLKALAEHYGIGVKGDEVIHAMGKRRQDFTPDELARYGAYCCNDVDLTYALFKRMAKGFPVSELMLIDLIIRMYTEPRLRINRDLLAQHLEAVRERKANLVDAMGLNCTEDEAKQTLMSNPKFAEYLQCLGVEPPTKVSARTGKTAWAFSKTDLAFTKLLEHDNEYVANAVAARLGVKSTLDETRTEAMIGIAQRGALPIMLRYYGAHTGRLSGADRVNLQNLPRGSALRRSLMAPEGHKIITSDLAQIEARMLAYMSGQDDLVEAFRDKRDVYSEFASDIYGRKITKADTAERFVGKTGVLSLQYGVGAAKFRNSLEIGQGGIKVIVDEDEATRIVRLYRDKNFKIAQLWRACDNALADMVSGGSGPLARVAEYTPEGLVLPNGLLVKYAALQRQPDGYAYIADARSYRHFVAGANDKVEWTKLYGAKVVENLCQALARVVITDQMLAISKRYKVVLQVHDEIVCVVSDAEVEDARAYIESIMSTPPVWAPELPIACEVGVGDNYAEAK